MTSKPTSRGARITKAEHCYTMLLSAYRLIGDPGMKEPLDYVLQVLSEIRHATVHARTESITKDQILERIWEQLIKPPEKGPQP